MSSRGYIRPFSREHSLTCWRNPGHEKCALRAAQSFLTARVAHDQGRLAMYRSALNSGPGRGIDEDVVDLARRQLEENHERDWSVEAPA